MQEPDPPAPEAVNPPTFYVPGTFRSDQSVGYLMRNVLRSIRDHANQRLAAHDLTYVQWLPLTSWPRTKATPSPAWRASSKSMPVR